MYGRQAQAERTTATTEAPLFEDLVARTKQLHALVGELEQRLHVAVRPIPPANCAPDGPKLCQESGSAIRGHFFELGGVVERLQDLIRRVDL